MQHEGCSTSDGMRVAMRVLLRKSMMSAGLVQRPELMASVMALSTPSCAIRALPTASRSACKQNAPESHEGHDIVCQIEGPV